MAVEVINTRYEVLETYPSSDTTPYVLHKARDVKEGRVVILKVLPAAIAARDPSLMTHLRATLRSTAALDHPMIARVYDAGELDNGDVYLVSDYIRGITLKERIRRVAPFSLAVASDIGVAIAEALAAAHRSAVLHGRLLPQNVTLSPEGQIRVGDFGVGRVVEDLLPDAAASIAPYLPPETTMEDEPAATDDIYALGAILYEMLTGVQPEAAEGDLPPSLRGLNPGVPPALEGITLKALHPDPDIRYQDAAALLADLQAARAALRAGRALTWSPLDAAASARPTVKPDRKTNCKPKKTRSDSDDDYEDEGRSYRESPSALGVTVCIMLLVAVLGIVGLFWYFSKLPPPDITVPHLVGETMDYAKIQSGQKHFVLVEKKRDFNTQWPEGQIYAQDPPSGRTIKVGKEVDVWVSSGPQFLSVPDLVGMTVDRAQRALHDSTLPGGTVTEAYSETVQKGVVLSQNPNPNTNASRYKAVNYVVSKGKEPPDSPTNVQADPIGPDRIQVSWVAGARAISYRVTRIADGATKVVAEADKDVKFLDTGLQPNSSYSYTVESVNSVGDSSPSDPTLVTMTPPPPDANGDENAVSVTPPGTDTTTASPDIAASAPSTPDPSDAPPDARPAQQRQFRVHFRIPNQPGGDHRVRLEVQDATGTTLVYDEMHHAGDRLSIPIPAFGSKVTFRIIVDETLMKQQTL